MVLPAISAQMKGLRLRWFVTEPPRFPYGFRFGWTVLSVPQAGQVLRAEIGEAIRL